MPYIYLVLLLLYYIVHIVLKITLCWRDAKLIIFPNIFMIHRWYTPMKIFCQNMLQLNYSHARIQGYLKKMFLL